VFSLRHGRIVTQVEQRKVSDFVYHVVRRKYCTC